MSASAVSGHVVALRNGDRPSSDFIKRNQTRLIFGGAVALAPPPLMAGPREFERMQCVET